EAAGEGFDSGLGNRRGNDVGRAYRCVGGGDAEDGPGVRGLEPAASAGHGAVQRAHEHDVDDGVPRAGREVFGAGDEVAGGVVDEDVEGSLAPDGIDHGFDGFKTADVAGEGVDGSLGREFGSGLFENFCAAAADVDRGSEFEEAFGHAFAEAGASAGDQDALRLQKIGAEHLFNSLRG